MTGRFLKGALAALATAQLALAPALPALARDGGGTLPAGTRIYLTLDEPASSARGGDDVGTIIRCRVWRDVEAGGVLIVKAGTPAVCRVDKVSRRNMGGTEGKISIGGVETHAVDGQTIMLSGGYHKEGSGHKAVVWTVGLLLFWPALFIPGGNAELPPGTVFDVATVNDLRFTAPASEAPKINLAAGETLSATFMLDDFVKQPKHDTFRIALAKEGALPGALVIDNINGQAIDPVALQVKDAASKDGVATAVGEVGVKALSKHFVRGINRFEVSYTENGERHATEVLIDVQM